VLEALERVNRELGTATAVITHNAAIAAMADRVDVRIVVWEAPDVLQVPTAALFATASNGRCMRFVTAGRARRRWRSAVKPGAMPKSCRASRRARASSCIRLTLSVTASG
jgi:hypothetical protein